MEIDTVPKLTPVQRLEAERKALSDAWNDEADIVFRLANKESGYNPVYRVLYPNNPRHDEWQQEREPIRQRIMQDRGSERFKNALDAFDSRIETNFRDWCINPSFLREEDRDHGLTALTYYVRTSHGQMGEIPCVTDAKGAISKLPPVPDLAAVRRFGFLSQEAWWQRIRRQVRVYKDYDGQTNDFTDQLYGASTSVANGEVKKYTSNAFGEMDFFTFSRFGKDFFVIAVIEQWVEPLVKNVAATIKRFEQDSRFQSLLQKVSVDTSTEAERLRDPELMPPHHLIAARLENELLPVNPSVMIYTLHRIRNEPIPVGCIPRPGVLIRSFIFSPDSSLLYWSETDKPAQWDIVQEWSYTVTGAGNALAAAAGVAVAHEKWVMGLSKYFEKHLTARNRAARVKGSRKADTINIYLDKLVARKIGNLQLAQAEAWRVSPQKKEIEASTKNNYVAVEAERKKFYTNMKRRFYSR